MNWFLHASSLDEPETAKEKWMKKTWDKTLEISQEFLGTSRLITEKGEIDSPVD